MDKSLNEFKEWFAIHYPESKDYLEITFFDYGKKLFVAKDTWNPDSVIAAKVLRMTFKAWQHQQAKVEELQKRVDKAIRLLVEAELYQSEPNIDLAVKALKGEG